MKMIKKIHTCSAITAFLLILLFFSSSIIVELFGDHHAVLMVKTSILYGIGLLIPMMVLTGFTGFKMAPKVKTGPIGNKKKRMPFIAFNGLLILLPCAIYLYHLASLNQFDRWFYIVQVVELIAGFINLILMTLNIRDAHQVKYTLQTA
ncbi:membrane protein [Photobacterium kishitanii]|uniref:Lipoprotein n=1 Tax=Photobacterium kishitanii TaxID=318456 RepID=A0AAX0YRL5_9GAMM|nr:hypothetical protein [Photobacterium kishitanii]KJG55838.1 membrane protein [Photobacterium kishitanii]KJG58857.1 membrane protein [Photobacterium kishitanii]KJG68145.1 membrane protein [Photobacterium kishitanii]PSX19027.1 hypothetical protein C0W70_11040 [Photobacterium kishitanii]PSX29028.1 hypothetical protein C0W52_07835 [Photobacterium kishitanii]